MTLENLYLDGVNGTPTGGAANGVRITSAGAVRLEHVNIFGFTAHGVDYESGGFTNLVIADSTIEGNFGAGVLAIPQNAAGELALISNSHIDQNGCGVLTGGVCGGTAAANSNPATVDVLNSWVDYNGYGAGSGAAGVGIGAYGATQISVGQDSIMRNIMGLKRTAGGLINSYGNNQITAPTDTPSSTSSLSARDVATTMAKLRARSREMEKAKKKKARRHKH